METAVLQAEPRTGVMQWVQAPRMLSRSIVSDSLQPCGLYSRLHGRLQVMVCQQRWSHFCEADMASSSVSRGVSRRSFESWTHNHEDLKFRLWTLLPNEVTHAAAERTARMKEAHCVIWNWCLPTETTRSALSRSLPLPPELLQEPLVLSSCLCPCTLPPTLPKAARVILSKMQISQLWWNAFLWNSE